MNRRGRRRAPVEQTERERSSAAARASSGRVLARLVALAEQLEELGGDLRAEVERRKREA